MYKARELICVDCGKKFISKHSLQIRCEKCQAVHKRALQTKYYKKHAAKKKKKERDLNDCMKKRTCYYGGNTCDYMLVTGVRRPCPVEGCTEYKKGKRRAQAFVISDEG